MEKSNEPRSAAQQQQQQQQSTYPVTLQGQVANNAAPTTAQGIPVPQPHPGLDHLPDEGPELDALYSSSTRRACVFLSIAQIITGFLVLSSFWAAYGWSIIMGILSVTMGVVGLAHYSSRLSLSRSTCCLAPTSFIEYQTYIQIPLAILSLLGTITAVVGAIYAPMKVFLAFAIINAFGNVSSGAVAIFLAIMTTQLRDYVFASHKARAPEPVAAIPQPQQTSTTHVVTQRVYQPQPQPQPVMMYAQPQPQPVMMYAQPQPQPMVMMQPPPVYAPVYQQQQPTVYYR